LVVTEGGIRKRFKPSSRITEFIPIGAPLSPDSLASQLSASHRKKDGLVPADAWIDISLSDVMIMEDSLLMPNYEKILTQQPVRLADVAKEIGLRIRYVPSSGFDGALVRLAGLPRGRIAVRASMEKSRRRFTTAHEIGHYVLPGHDSENSVCRAQDVGQLREDSDSLEQAANKFAGELLMPSLAVRRIVKKFGVSMDTCKFISDQFEVSLTAAAVKCVEVTDRRAALVVTEGGIRKSFKPS